MKAGELLNLKEKWNSIELKDKYRHWNLKVWCFIISKKWNILNLFMFSFQNNISLSIYLN